ncbi:MAG: hypothetical protein V4592_13145 [Bacteroidota bacterium]
MTTLTVNIQNESELTLLKETLKKLGFNYSIDTDKDYMFTEAEIASFVKTRQDFLDGKTTARSWDDIEEDLNRAYN